MTVPEVVSVTPALVSTLAMPGVGLVLQLLAALGAALAKVRAELRGA